MKNKKITDAEMLRQKAEEHLKLKQNKVKAPAAEVDMLKLIHELEVHQIELEMQNEELVSALEKAEDNYAELYDYAPSGFMTLSKTGNITKINFAAANILHKDRSQLMKSAFALFVSENTRSVFRVFLESVLMTKVKQTCEVVLAIKDKPPIYVIISGVISQIGDFCLLTLADITARKESEIKIQIAEENLRNTFRLSPSIISKANTNTGFFIEVNEAVTKTLGYSVEEFTSTLIPEMIHPDDVKETTDKVAEQINGKEVICFENRYLCKDGTYKWMAWQGSPADNNGIVTAIGTDITVRKETEAHLLKNQYYLEKAQELGNIGTWELDLLANKLFWTDETYKIFGIPLGTEMTYEIFIKSIHPEDRDYFTEKWLDALTSGVYDIEHRIIVKRKHKWVREKATIEFNTNGNAIKAIGFVQDITTRKKHENELRIAKERAEESDSLKSAFLANMSHEIRTPMNGILGFASMLKDLNLKREDQQEYIQIIEKCGERLLNTINGIIDISKIESGQMLVNITDLKLNKVLQDCCNFFMPEAEKKNLELRLSKFLRDEESIIRTDDSKLNSIFANLVRNAIKYTNHGSIEFGYVLNSAKTELEFYVRDTGAGIPKHRQTAVFERFIQADIKDSMALQGSGLGLTIAKAYVEMLGGKLWMKSEEGVGSTFYFTLPYLNVTVPEIDSSETISAKQNQVRNLKILIVEDDEFSAQLLSFMVSDFAKEIISVSAGKDAVEICKSNPDIDLVLMDILLPDMDGYETTRQIRKFNKKIIIVSQTAFALSNDREKSIIAGCSNYISKPIQRNKLELLIQKYFEDYDN